MRWDGVGVEETVCCPAVLAPLPSLLSATGQGSLSGPKQLPGASWATAGGCFLKAAFALLERPRTTGCSFSKWLLNRAQTPSRVSLLPAKSPSSAFRRLRPKFSGRKKSPALKLLLSSFYAGSFHLPTTMAFTQPPPTLYLLRFWKL